MLKLKDESIAIYKGDYKPLEVLKNNQEIASFKTVGMNREEEIFENTYNDIITVYGKSGYLQGKNLCPPPTSKSEDYKDECFLQITVKENGYFDVIGKMITGAEITKTQLKAGTYTVSGCGRCFVWWEENGEFLSLPCTFTLDNQTEVLVCMWDTSNENLSLENQYIQIEKGNVATEYAPFTGNLDFGPSIQNSCKIISSSGELRVESANLIPHDFGKFNQWELEPNSTNASSRVYWLDLPPGDYRLTFKISETYEGDTYGYLNLQETEDDWQNINSYYEPIQKEYCDTDYEFTIKENFKYRFWCWGMARREEAFCDWHLQRRDIPNGKYMYFEPYSVSASLRGIEVAENDAYNYCENKAGKMHYYISDVLSGDSVKRNVGNIKITGQEEFLQKHIESNDFNCYYCDLSNIISRNRTADSFLCSCFETLNDLNAEKEGAVLGNDDTNLYFLVSKNRFSTVDSFVSWLKNVYQNGTGMEINYILDSEKSEPSNLEKTLKSFPVFTRIFNHTKENSLPLGLEQCVKIQQIK